jgi:hypothetical protein
MGEMTAPSTQREREYYNDPEVREQIEDRIYHESLHHGDAIRAHFPDRNPFAHVDGYQGELDSAFPDERGTLIPEEGAWIVVKAQPYTNIPAPPLYSMWFAKPVYVAREFKRILADGRNRTIKWPMHRARITTPDGELTLLGGEYSVVKDLRPYLEMIGEGVDLHFIGPEPDEVRERIFYLQAHGLHKGDAIAMVLPDLEDAGFCYLTLDLGDI